LRGLAVKDPFKMTTVRFEKKMSSLGSIYIQYVRT
jgi:hypothetical protein